MNMNTVNLNEVLQLLSEVKHKLDAAEPAKMPEQDITCNGCEFQEICNLDSPSDDGTTFDAVIIPMEDFQQMVQEVEFLMMITNTIFEYQERQEHLIHTLLDVAARLGANAKEDQDGLRSLVMTGNSILEHWTGSFPAQSQQ